MHDPLGVRPGWSRIIPPGLSGFCTMLDTEYDLANVPPYNVRCANTQLFLCNDLGPFSGNFRQFAWALFREFQAILGNCRRDFGRCCGANTQAKKTVFVNKKKAEDCTPKQRT